MSYGNNSEFIPVGVDQFLILIANFPDNLWLSVFTHDDTLESLSNDTSPFFGIKHAKVLWLRMEVSLIPFDGIIFGLADELASVLDAGVISGETDFCFEDKICNLTVLPDQKRISLSRLFFSGLAVDCAVFDRPKLCLSSPAGEVFAIKERLEILCLNGETQKWNEKQCSN